MSASRSIRRARVRALAAMLVPMVVLAAVPRAFAEVTVILRGNAEPVTGIGAVAALRGLEVQQGGVQQGGARASVVVPWDMVRSVEGATIAGLEGELAVGQDLWRARIRVERGDEALAEPLLLKHWDRYRLQDGPTTAVVAEGLLRCALARGDLRASVEPWFVCLRIGSNGEPSRYPELAGVLDDTTGLLPEASPFLPSSRRNELAEALAAIGRSAGSSAAASAAGVAGDCAARLARMLAATEAGASIVAASDPGRDAAPSVRALGLIETILTAPDRRSADRAVAEFERILPDPPGYLAAWKLAAAGAQAARSARALEGEPRARALEGEPRARALESAALALLAVPASGLDKSGLVDAYALEEAVALLKEAGDQVSAAQVATILEERLRDAAGGRR
jgi:hypothetical protein